MRARKGLQHLIRCVVSSLETASTTPPQQWRIKMATTKTTKKAAKGSAKGAKKDLKPVKHERPVMWVNLFDLLPGDPSVTTSFNAVISGVGSVLTGLVIQSSTTGDTA